MTENTTSPTAAPLRRIDAADRLYDASALVSAISARVVQLAHESNELTDTGCTELTRLLALVHRQVEEVADALFTLKLEN